MMCQLATVIVNSSRSIWQAGWCAHSVCVCSSVGRGWLMRNWHWQHPKPESSRCIKSFWWCCMEILAIFTPQTSDESEPKPPTETNICMNFLRVSILEKKLSAFSTSPEKLIKFPPDGIKKSRWTFPQKLNALQAASFSYRPQTPQLHYNNSSSLSHDIHEENRKIVESSRIHSSECLPSEINE